MKGFFLDIQVLIHFIEQPNTELCNLSRYKVPFNNKSLERVVIIMYNIIHYNFSILAKFILEYKRP